MSWSSHIDTILGPVSPMADALSKLKYSVDKESFEQIYFSFIRPNLEYGCHIWDNCDKGDKKKKDFQLSIARTVTGARKGTSHELISNELNWPSLTDRREGVQLRNFLKIMNNEMLQYVVSLIPETFGTNRPQSRNPDNFYSMRARIETYRSSFIPLSVRLYNSLHIVRQKNRWWCIVLSEIDTKTSNVNSTSIHIHRQYPSDSHSITFGYSLYQSYYMFSFTISATFPLSYCFYSLFCSLSLFLQSIFIVYLCGSRFCSVLSCYVFTVYLSTTLYFPSLSSTSYFSSSKFHLLLFLCSDLV